MPPNPDEPVMAWVPPKSDGGWPSGPSFLAAAWFGGVLLLLAAALTLPVIGLAAFYCSSGAPECGPERALALMWGAVIGLAVAFAVIVLCLDWLARRWRPARWFMRALGFALLGLPVLATMLAMAGTGTWLTAGALAIWVVVPGAAIIRAARDRPLRDVPDHRPGPGPGESHPDP